MKFIPLSFALLLAVSPALAQKQMTAEEEAIYKQMMKSAGMDPASAGQNLEAAKAPRPTTNIYNYRIIGVFQGRANVVGGSSWIGYADVTDRVEIDLKWDISESKLVGTPVIKNTKSTVKNPRNAEPSCNPPVIKGDYEHYELLGIKDGLGGALELMVRTDHPVVDVAQVCKGGRKTVPASRVTRPREMVVPSPLGQFKKSLTIKNEGWTWTYAPTPAK